MNFVSFCTKGVGAIIFGRLSTYLKNRKYFLIGGICFGVLYFTIWFANSGLSHALIIVILFFAGFSSSTLPISFAC